MKRKRTSITTTTSNEVFTEAKLLVSVRHAADQAGWLCYHTWSSIHSPRGLPDLVLLRNGKLAFWELKSTVGKLTPAQQVWLDALAQVPGVDVRVVRPDDLESAYKYLAGIKEELDAS